MVGTKVRLEPILAQAMIWTAQPHEMDVTPDMRPMVFESERVNERVSE